MKKPGFKTSEFWCSTAVAICGILYASGIISPEGVSGVEKAVAFIAAALASFGYSQSRGMVKSSGPKEPETNKPLG